MMFPLALALMLLAFVGGVLFGLHRARRQQRPTIAPPPAALPPTADAAGATAEAAGAADPAADGPGDATHPASGEATDDRIADAAAGPTPGSPDDPAAPATAASEPLDLEQLLQRLVEPYDESGDHPNEVIVLPHFQQALAILSDPAVPIAQLVEGVGSGRSVLAMVSAEALAARAGAAEATAEVLKQLRGARVWTLFGLLRFLGAQADRPVIWPVLLQAPDYWAGNSLMPRFLDAFIEARAAQGEALDGPLSPLPGVEFSQDSVRTLLAALRCPAAPRLREALDLWERTRVDAQALGEIGRVWPDAGRAGTDAPPQGDPVIGHPALQQTADAVVEALSAQPPRPVVLVGDPGVGKTAVVRHACTLLQQRGWTVFEASASDIMVGQSYLGQLEDRLRKLLVQIDAARKVVWVVPGFAELGQVGRHRHSSISALDMVLGAITAGRIVLLGESAPAAMEQLLKQKPRLRFAVTVLKVEPLPVQNTLAVARELLTREVIGCGLAAEPSVAEEALELARSYLGASAMPGSVLGLLRQTRQRVLAAGGDRISRDEVLATVSSITGLPRAVLDERTGLDAAALRAHFAQRVMGQPEAVRCLVDRVAMLKAGLVDPRRPIGVFLFAGPTGTGKTEVAKTLATFLFGSPERMLRLDMSELQSPASMSRLVGDRGESEAGESLTDQIRKQPFSVVLLDEFEKAHPQVWDLFLQVFDDGRLTDANGQVADFRHAIIILTSNAGATSHQSGSLGFSPGGADFSEAQVTRALSGLFRPEFINRIDRVVVFRPLSKLVMREILKKELGDVVKRRGFRNRDWAVEWEPSAIDFLLERGFTPDMGARPLRRAIEEHLLAPLAMTIVENRFPEGDQFLFARSDGRGIQVAFIDPDEPALPASPSGTPSANPSALSPAAAADAEGAGSGAAAGLSLGRLSLAPRGDAEARRFVLAQLAALAERLQGEAWRAQKDALLAMLNHEGFWAADDRFRTLDRMERMDRIEAEAEGLQSLARRLQTGRAPALSVVAGIAQRLHQTAAALHDLDCGLAGDAFIAIEPVAAEGSDGRSPDWARRLGRMYREWARRRGLRLHALQDEAAEGAALLAISGLGVSSLLAREAGLHVFETPDDREGFDRIAARVRTAPQPLAPSRPDQQRELALRCLAAAPPASIVVRRYREEPSPLVRDAVAGWRTGRLGDVLDGGFDLFDPA